MLGKHRYPGSDGGTGNRRSSCRLPEDAGEKVKQCFFEQCSEVAGLNSQVVSQAVSRALPTLKSIRT